MNIVGVPLQFIKIDQENVIAMEISVLFQLSMLATLIFLQKIWISVLIPRILAFELFSPV